MRRRKISSLITATLLLIPSCLLYSQTNLFISVEVQPAAGCNIIIQWEAFAKWDTVKYEVEKSRDKKNWKVIAHEKVRSSHRYFIMDNEPEDSLNFYRIRQSGSQDNYSEIKWVQVNTATDVFIWPNSAGNILHVKTPFLNGTMDIVDANGNLLVKMIITDFITEVYTAALGKGTNFLNIRSSNRFLVETFVKE